VTRVTEKLVLSFDAKSQSYKPAGHNFVDWQAVELTSVLQASDKKPLTVDQEDHHHARDFHRCKACKKAAEDATSKHSQASGQQVEPPSAENAMENEGD